MSCCSNKEDERRTVFVGLRRDELLYDIRNIAWVEGDVLPTQDEHQRHQRHQVQDIGEDGNVDRVTRILDLAYSECVEMLFPYTKRPVEGEVGVDNSLDAREIYLIELSLPASYSVTTVTLVRKLCHEYMVARVLADWLSITNPQAAAKWAAKAEATEKEIDKVKNLRTKAFTRKTHPW